MQTQPATVISLLTAAVMALLGVAAAFGLDLDDAQRNAVLGAVGPLVLVIAAIGPVIKQFVVSPKTAADAVVTAKQDTSPTPTVPQINMIGGAYDAAVEAKGYATKPPPVN